LINWPERIAHGERTFGVGKATAGGRAQCGRLPDVQRGAGGERGFLAEHARRSRTANTEQLLAALARIEALVRANAAAPADLVRMDLRTLLAAIRSARPEIEASQLPARAAKLAVLLDLLEERITALAGPASMPAVLDATA
jgi:hypothetical protein